MDYTECEQCGLYFDEAIVVSDEDAVEHAVGEGMDEEDARFTYMTGGIDLYVCPHCGCGV